MIEQSNADNIPDLKPCPFCGRKAAYMGYDLRDPISGKPRSRVMIGCPAAFTARGDWGDGHKTCPVAPMIDSWAAPAGTDVVAAWNRRADVISAGKVFTLHEKTAGAEWWHEFQTEEQRECYKKERKIWAHYNHARKKHPHFCDELARWEKHAALLLEYTCRQTLATRMEIGDFGADDVLQCELAELMNAVLNGHTADAIEEAYDCIAVLLRVIDVLEGRQQLGKPEDKPCK